MCECDVNYITWWKNFRNEISQTTFGTRVLSSSPYIAQIFLQICAAFCFFLNKKANNIPKILVLVTVVFR